MGRKVTWIGWELNFSAGGFRLPKEKRDKAIALLEACFSGRHVPKKHLDKVLGLIQWILQCAPELRPWLCCLYDDMHRPLGTAYSVDPSEWPCIAAHLSDSLQFISTPRGTSIPVGSSLLSARRTNLKTKADLRLVPISTRRVWLRVADPSSSRRKLSEPSREMLRFLLWWCKHPWPWRPLALPPVLPFESAADAFGEGDACGVGGWLRLGSAQCFWFSERFCPADFRKLGIPVKDDANLDISAYETLAQGFLLVLLLRTISGGRLRVRLPALSDNVGAESVINRLYTSKQPLALFVQRLAMWACAHSVSLACSHIAGEKNDEADALSRWDEASPVPHDFGRGVRVRISLSSFWDVHLQPQLLPPGIISAVAIARATWPLSLRLTPALGLLLHAPSRFSGACVLLWPTKLWVSCAFAVRAGLPMLS